MKRFTLLTLAAALLLAFASVAFAAAPAAQPMRKVDSFDFLVDYSGSMMMKHTGLGENKMEVAKTVLQRVNDRIPLLGYQGGLHTFAEDGELTPIQPYTKESLGAGIDALRSDLEVFHRLTPMGDGISYWTGALYNGMPSPKAVIIVSDGNKNRGMDPLQAAQEAYAANPGLCFHVISLADNKEGQEYLDAITSLKPECSVSVMAGDLLASDDAVMKFVNDVFVGRGGIDLRSIQFAFDSDVINSESADILDELAGMLVQGGSNITIAGHTCSIGTEEYNQRLSERRAASVKRYLVKKGIPESSMTAVGYGESNPAFDNSTEEGRRLNRRAEIDFN